MQTEDPTQWIPRLLIEDWERAISQLQDEGTRVPYDKLPGIFAASDKRSGGQQHGRTLLKTYESADSPVSMQGWGDRTRDTEITFTVQVTHKGSRAPEAAYSARLVLDRIMLRRRSNPHADWQRIENWRFNTVEDYPDWQRFALTMRFTSKGVLVPKSVEQT